MFARPDGARILIMYRVKSLVRIDTGCAKGEVYEGWPAGTEAVPERLRTTGRHEDGNPPETWAPYSPPGSPSAAEGRSDYLLRLGAYKEALLKVKSKVEGADADSADGFKRPPRWRNEIV